MASKMLRFFSRGSGAARRALPQMEPSAVLASRPFSTGAAVEEDVVKAAFVRQQQQFRDYLQGLAAVPIPLTPEDDKAVRQYADAVKKIREKVGVRSFTEKLADLLESAEEDSQDVRTFLHNANSVRKQIGVEDPLGVESLMLSALEKVEKKLGKPLTTGDAQGLAALQQEFASVNSSLGMKEGDLEKLEGELDVLLAKGEIEALRNEALEKINTYKRRDALENIDLDVKELKPTAYI